MLVSKTFGQYEVTFSILVGKVLFGINGSYTHQHNPHKVAITRWLLKCFNQAKSQNPYLYCCPFKEDGKGDYRSAIFQKVGFKPASDGTLEWGTKYRPPVVEKTDYYHKKEGRLDVLANTGEWLTSILLPFRYKQGSLLVTDNVGDWHKAVPIR